MIPVKDEKVKKMMEYIKGWPRDLTPAQAKKVISYYLEELCDVGIDMLIEKEEVAKVIREGGEIHRRCQNEDCINFVEGTASKKYCDNDECKKQRATARQRLSRKRMKANISREAGYDPMTEARGECKDEKGKHR